MPDNRKKKLFRTSFDHWLFTGLVLLTSSAWAGDKEGNGGDAVVCFKSVRAFEQVKNTLQKNLTSPHPEAVFSDPAVRAQVDSVRTYDLFKYQIPVGYPPVSPSVIDPVSANPDHFLETIDFVLNRVEEQTYFGTILKNLRDSVYPISNWRADHGIAEISDSGELIYLPKNCLLVQAARRDLKAGLIRFDINLFSLMASPLDRAALALHEWVYAYLFDRAQSNSENTQAIVGLFFSKDEYDSLRGDEFLDFLFRKGVLGDDLLLPVPVFSAGCEFAYRPRYLFSTGGKVSGVKQMAAGISAHLRNVPKELFDGDQITVYEKDIKYSVPATIRIGEGETPLKLKRVRGFRCATPENPLPFPEEIEVQGDIEIKQAIYTIDGTVHLSPDGKVQSITFSHIGDPLIGRESLYFDPLGYLRSIGFHTERDIDFRVGPQGRTIKCGRGPVLLYPNRSLASCVIRRGVSSPEIYYGKKYSIKVSDYKPFGCRGFDLLRVFDPYTVAFHPDGTLAALEGGRVTTHQNFRVGDRQVTVLSVPITCENVENTSLPRFHLNEAGDLIEATHVKKFQLMIEGRPVWVGEWAKWDDQGRTIETILQEEAIIDGVVLKQGHRLQLNPPIP